MCLCGTRRAAQDLIGEYLGPACLSTEAVCARRTHPALTGQGLRFLLAEFIRAADALASAADAYAAAYAAAAADAENAGSANNAVTRPPPSPEQATAAGVPAATTTTTTTVEQTTRLTVDSVTTTMTTTTTTTTTFGRQDDPLIPAVPPAPAPPLATRTASIVPASASAAARVHAAALEFIVAANLGELQPAAWTLRTHLHDDFVEQLYNVRSYVRVRPTAALATCHIRTHTRHLSFPYLLPCTADTWKTETARTDSYMRDVRFVDGWLDPPFAILPPGPPTRSVHGAYPK